jgi:hypothetical protein
MWCDDLSALQAELAASGGEIVIEKARPIGATPLKVIADSDFSHSAPDQRRDSPKQRTLDQ